MDLTKLQANNLNIDCTKIEIFKLLSKCIKDIDKTVSASGLTMHDVGIKYREVYDRG